MESWIRDLRFALRALRRSPLFFAVAVITLAFGIGVNATMFTFVNAVLLRPLPVERPDELLSVFTQLEEESFATSSYLDYLDLRDQQDVFSDLVGHSMAIANLQLEGRSEVLIGEMVTGNFFSALGITPSRGRALMPDDVEPGAAPAVVLSHGLWQRRFGADPRILGTAVRFNAASYEVVGVAPEGFPGLMPGLAAEFWIPATRVGEIDAAGQIYGVHNDPGETLLERRGYRWMWMKGRLLPGVEPEQAEARLETIMARLAERHPITNEGCGLITVPVSESRFHPAVDRFFGPAAIVLLGAVALVLLIVCANLANMLLSRAEGRRREIAIRLALGAGRGRLVRQLLAESLVLAVLGAAAALLIAGWAHRLLLTYQLPIRFEIHLDMGLDGRVVAFTAMIALGAAFVFGLVPALQASSPDLVPALKQGSGASAAKGRFHLKNALVVAQVAVSLVLLVSGALLLRGLTAAEAIDVGFAPHRVADLVIQLEMYGYDAERAETFFETLRERVAALPGVEAAAVATRVPFDMNLNNRTILPDATRPEAKFQVEVTWVDPEYFVTVGVPLVRGRGFTTSDARGSPRVAVVNAAMARRFYPNTDAVGQRFHVGGLDTEPYEIIGIAADHKVRTVGEEPRPFLHFARAQREVTYAHILARSTGADARPLAAAMIKTALEVDPELAFGEAATLGDLMDLSLFPVRAGAALLGAFGVLALVLASLGLYGVIAYSVSRRDREIGVRVALGARPRDVLGLVLRGGMTLVMVGMAVGLLLALGLSRFLAGFLYGLPALDPLAFCGAALLLAAVAFAANYVPALRATRVEVLAALRQD